MNVKMWNALADAIIHGHESAVRFHPGFNRPRQHLYVFEKRFDLIDGQVGQSFAVRFWNNQTVTGKNRPMIEEGNGSFVFKDNAGPKVAADNFAEKAGRSSHFVRPGYTQFAQRVEGRNSLGRSPFIHTWL